MTTIVVQSQGRETAVDARGGTVMTALRAAGLPVLGECNGSLACATCHVIVDPEWAARLPPPSEEEEDMLDTVFDLKATSRLCCQFTVGPAIDGLRLRLPD